MSSYTTKDKSQIALAKGQGESTKDTPDKAKLPRKNLIVCIDGTQNKYGEKNTHIIELYRLLEKNDTDSPQLTWYDSGIGTCARPSWRPLKYLRQVIQSKIDAVTVRDFERAIISAYGWLGEHYEDGDQIFLFGFSRGAYQVRVLSAMIHTVGLICKGNQTQVAFAYDLYASTRNESMNKVIRKWNKGVATNATYSEVGNVSFKNKTKTAATTTTLTTTTTKSEPEFEFKPVPQTKRYWFERIISIEWKTEREIRTEKMATEFKNAFSRNVKVQFVGAWDTVSSVGIVRGKTLPGTIKGMAHVTYFRHALALDERRVKFLPEYVCGGDSKDDPAQSQPKHIKEVRFAGTH